MAKILYLVKDEAYLWFDITSFCKALDQDIPDYAIPLELSDEDAERYERFVSEFKYWNRRFEEEINGTP